MAELRVVDKIQLQNRNEIQLAFGSVTKIGKDEEADVLVVSAFPSMFLLNIHECKNDLGHL